METLEGLNQLIYKRLIEQNGNVKLSENIDIIQYGRALGILENQLMLRVIDINEKINWAEVEKKKQQDAILRAQNLNPAPIQSNPQAVNTIVICSKCNTRNDKRLTKFCKECGTELNQNVQQPQSIPQPIVVPEPNQNQTRFVETEPVTATKSKGPILVKILIVLAVILAGYFFWGKDYLKDKNATRMYSFASSLALRSSAEGGNNMIANIPYGSEILVYDEGVDWVNCKFNDEKGYASPKYLLNKLDFQELNAILANENSRKAVTETRFKKALLYYFRENNFIGKMDNEVQKEIYGTVTTRPVWQFSGKGKKTTLNTIYFSNTSKQKSKYNDFACIIKNLNNQERKTLIFSFDNDENPTLEGEYVAPENGYLSGIEYDYDDEGILSLTPVYN